MERTPPLIVTSQNLIGADWWVVFDRLRTGGLHGDAYKTNTRLLDGF